MVKTQLESVSTSEVVSRSVQNEALSLQNQRRGLVWVVGAFAICPCHLPFTLGLLATLLGGSGLGVVLQEYPIIAGAIISFVWVTATWRGFLYLRATNSLKTCQVKRR